MPVFPVFSVHDLVTDEVTTVSAPNAAAAANRYLESREVSAYSAAELAALPENLLVDELD